MQAAETASNTAILASGLGGEVKRLRRQVTALEAQLFGVPQRGLSKQRTAGSLSVPSARRPQIGTLLEGPD